MQRNISWIWVLFSGGVASKSSPRRRPGPIVRFILVTDAAVITQPRTVAHWAAQARQVVRDGGKLLRCELRQRSCGLRVQVGTVTAANRQHLLQEVRVVLVAQRRHESLVITACI